jgi:uncharacterized membrane protein
MKMERPLLTTVALEEGEGSTALVGSYVGFFSEGVGIRKGKVVAWDGLDRGYTVRLLGKKDCASGVAEAHIAFLVYEEQVDARIEDGVFSLEELVGLYVGFFSEGVGIRKGKVVAWDGPERGYTVRLLGSTDCVSGVAGADVAFFDHQEEVDARVEDGDSSLAYGCGERRSSGMTPRLVETERGPFAAYVSHGRDC